MLIGKDDISNDVITLSTCFSMLVYSRDRFRFALIGGKLTAHSTGSYRGIRGGRHSCKLSFLFPPRCQRAPESLLASYAVVWVLFIVFSIFSVESFGDCTRQHH